MGSSSWILATALGSLWSSAYEIDLSLVGLPAELRAAEVTLSYEPSSLSPVRLLAIIVDFNPINPSGLPGKVETLSVPIESGRLRFSAPRRQMDFEGPWRLRAIVVRYGDFHFELQPQDFDTHFSSERPRWRVEDGKVLVYEGPQFLLGHEAQPLPRDYRGFRAVVDHRPFSRCSIPWRTDGALMERLGWELRDGDWQQPARGARLGWNGDVGLLTLPERGPVRMGLFATCSAPELLLVDKATLDSFLATLRPPETDKERLALAEALPKPDEFSPMQGLVLVRPEEWRRARASSLPSRELVTTKPLAGEQHELTFSSPERLRSRYAIIGCPLDDQPFFAVAFLSLR